MPAKVAAAGMLQSGGGAWTGGVASLGQAAAAGWDAVGVRIAEQASAVRKRSPVPEHSTAKLSVPAGPIDIVVAFIRTNEITEAGC